MKPTGLLLRNFSMNLKNCRGNQYIHYTLPNSGRKQRFIWREILESKKNFCPIPLISKSGDLLYVETKISQGKWNGKPAIFSLSKDVTERRLAEESAKKNEERYRILFENINDAVFVHEFTDKGLPGRFLEVNEIACERLGYTREELLKMSPADIDAPESLCHGPSGDGKTCS